MAPSYVLAVASEPRRSTFPPSTATSTWTEWYNTEHIPDMVTSGVSKYGSIYRAIPGHPLTANEPANAMSFLALYQSEWERPPFREANETGKVRQGSELFPGGVASGKTCYDFGDFEARNFALVQDYDPKGVGDSPAPYIIYVLLTPASPSDLDKWYRQEHLAAIASHTGYRRSLRYRAGEAEVGASPSDHGELYLAIHEFDQLPDALDDSVNETEWTKRVLSEAKGFQARAFELLSSQGFQEEGRK